MPVCSAGSRSKSDSESRMGAGLSGTERIAGCAAPPFEMAAANTQAKNELPIDTLLRTRQTCTYPTGEHIDCRSKLKTERCKMRLSFIFLTVLALSVGVARSDRATYD